MLQRVVFKPLTRISRMTFSSEVSTKVEQKMQKKDIQYYKDGQMMTRSAIVLKKEEDIDQYAINVVKNYFRTLNKANVTLESSLKDHGLDSLDSIEISMQVPLLSRSKKTWAIPFLPRHYRFS